MDGTLRKARLFPAAGPLATWDQTILPGRLQRMRRLRGEGHRLGAVSNQALVAMGLLTLPRCELIMEETNRRLDGLLEWIRICPHHPLGLRPRYRRAGGRVLPGGAPLSWRHGRVLPRDQRAPPPHRQAQVRPGA
ncbi:MAG: hypothetical protein E6J00_10760, partial [Chloroflexi bacterium]